MSRVYEGGQDLSGLFALACTVVSKRHRAGCGKVLTPHRRGQGIVDTHGHYKRELEREEDRESGKEVRKEERRGMGFVF